MKYKVRHTTQYAYSSAVPVCHNLVHLQPRCLPIQSCEHFRLTVHPEPSQIVHRRDYFGNQVSYFSIDQAHNGLTVTAASEVTVSKMAPIEPSSTPCWEEVARNLKQARNEQYLQAYEFAVPSPAVRPFAQLAEYAQSSFSPDRSILEAVIDLTNRIHTGFRYDARATTVRTPIDEVFQQRHGVCQDFAHLEIGCLRSLGLAARYVSGYLRTVPPPGKPRLVGADASHAWLSVFCGPAGWIDVDPTNNVLTATDHITLAWGREYNDVSPIQGVIVAGGDHKMTVSVDVAPIDNSG